jgi:hypothetical protein
MSKSNSKFSIMNKDELIDVPITNNETMNIYFNKKTKLVYFQDSHGSEYDLNGFSRGFMGADGEKGDMGNPGLQGEKGNIGPKGDRGYNGRDGSPGLKGEQGEIGIHGPKGDRGIRGITGETGLKGEIGLKGERGCKGDKGDRGDCGPKGDKGDKGDRGCKGDRGDRGDPGPRGICSCVKNQESVQSITNQIIQKENLFVSDGMVVEKNKDSFNFDIPCSSNIITAIKFNNLLKKNIDEFAILNNQVTQINLLKKGVYKIKYNVCWFVNIKELADNIQDDTNKKEIIKEAKKTIKGGIVCFCFDDNQMIHQSTIHSQGSVFINSASHTFVINKRSSDEYNNISIGLHKAYENEQNIDVSIHAEGTFMEIEYIA